MTTRIVTNAVAFTVLWIVWLFALAVTLYAIGLICRYLIGDPA